METEACSEKDSVSLPSLNGRRLAVRRFSRAEIPTEALRPHRHDFFELFWIQQGQAVHLLDGAEHPIKAGSLVFVNIGQIHFWEFSADVEGYVIFFSPELLVSGGVTGHSRLSFLPGLGSSPVIPVPVAERGNIQFLCERIAAEQSGALSFCNECCRACLELLLIEFGRHALAGASAPLHGRPQWVRKFLSLLEQHFRSLHRIQDYAEKMQISTSSLSQAVQAETGKTPAFLIRERRLQEAQQLLRHTDLSIGEIAFELGFKSPSNFGRFLRSYLGKTPGELRSRSDQ